MANNKYSRGRQQAGSNVIGTVREYLFVSIFRACAESLASEYASRLAAMQRAEKTLMNFLKT